MEQGRVYVFLSECDYNAPPISLIPEARHREVAAVNNQRLRCEKQGVWQLLTLALGRLGSSIEDIKPYKSESGKWCSDKLCFSLSHSNSLLGVAISKEPLGIDIENVGDFARRYSDAAHLSGFLDKIRAKGEADTPTVQNLISLWTAKESVYKMRGTGVFSPASINTLEFNITAIKWQSEGQEYHISLCTQDPLTDVKNEVILEYIAKM